MNSKVDDTKALFRCIVTMDYFRILSRLRSRHAKKKTRDKNKPVLITQLNTAIHDLSVPPNSTVTSLELDDIRTKVKALATLFSKFEDLPDHSAVSTDVQDVAMELIIHMHDLISQMKLRLALQSSSRLESGHVTFLHDAVGKLARYYSISNELVCAARTKEYSVFNHIAIEKCTVRPPLQPSTVDKNLHPLTSLQRTFRPSTTGLLKTSLERSLEKSYREISDEFRSIIAEYYKFVKVHAEVQLLFFYELNKVRLKPRVICSSKSACYLCNLFFKLHNQFYIPRGHGRLYHQWTLPDWHDILPKSRKPEFDVLVGQFNDVLKVRIKATLDAGVVRLNHPNESAFVMPAHCSTTTSISTQATHSNSESPASLRLAQTRKQFIEVPNSSILNSSSFPQVHASKSIEVASSLSLQPLGEITTKIASRSSGTPILPLPTGDPISPRDLPPRDTSIDFPTSSSQKTSNPSSTATQRPQDDLNQGEPAWHQTPYPGISINIGTRRLHLHLSYDATPAQYADSSSIPSSHCWVRVKWLQDNDTEAINSQAVNVEDLVYDAEMKLSHGATATPTELHLRREDDVVSVKYTFNEPSKTRVGEGKGKEKGDA